MKIRAIPRASADKRTARERERRRLNREAILHAAEAVVCRKGLSAASMDDIAAEAGFSKATLYRYVRNKAELVSELLIHFLEDLDARLKPIVQGPLDPEAKLLAAIREGLRFQEEKEKVARIFVLDRSFLRVMHIFAAEQGMPGAGTERSFLRRLQAARRIVYSSLEALLREGIQAGVFRPLPVERTVSFISAFLQGYSHEKLWRDSKPEIEKDVLDIHAMLFHGLTSGKKPSAEGGSLS